MKLATCLVLIVVLFLSFNLATAQLLNLPESVIYDSLRYRYLVSNWNSGDIVQIDTLGQQAFFTRGAGLLAGICIVGDTLWAAGQNQGVKGFDLESGNMIRLASIPNIELLNDIVADTSGNLYLSDTRVHKIFRYNIAADESYEFVTSGLNVPNGMVHDPEHNRLVLVSSINDSPVQAIDLADSSLTTIIETYWDIMDGITRDEYGNYYISAWGSNYVYRYNSDFIGNPTIFSRHGRSPADIFYDRHHDMLAVPLYHSNILELIPAEPSGIDEENIPTDYAMLSGYPNPFNAVTTIAYNLPEPQTVRLDIYDLLGQRITTLAGGHMTAGPHRLTWQADNCPSGMYFARLIFGKTSQSVKLLLLK